MQRTKEKIFDVAINYIKQGKNLEKVSLNEIAQAACIGKSTVYEYFTSKEELIEEAYIQLIRDYHFKLIDNIMGDTFTISLKKQIRAIIMVMEDAKIIMEAILENPCRISNNNEKISEEIKIVQNYMLSQFIKIFNLGKEENLITNKYQNDSSKYIIKALITSLSIQYVSGETSLNEEQIIDLIYDSLIACLQ